MMPPSAVTEEPPTLSIVAPVYNEALRLEGTRYCIFMDVGLVTCGFKGFSSEAACRYDLPR